MNAQQSIAFREGHTLGQLHGARGLYIPRQAESKAARLGYEAGWRQAFFAKHADKKQPQPILL